MRGVPGIVLLVVSLVGASCAAAADEGKIHECTDSKGQVVYQDEPCPKVVPPTPKRQASPKPPRPTEPRPSRGPVDARWSTPEKALKTFVGAVTAGDRPLIWASLTSSALADLGPDADAIPLENLQELVGSFTGYVTEGDLGPVWSIRAKRAGQRPKWIFFERTRIGEWKIAAI